MFSVTPIFAPSWVPVPMAVASIVSGLGPREKPPRSAQRSSAKRREHGFDFLEPRFSVAAFHYSFPEETAIDSPYIRCGILTQAKCRCNDQAKPPKPLKPPKPNCQNGVKSGRACERPEPSSGGWCRSSTC